MNEIKECLKKEKFWLVTLPLFISLTIYLILSVNTNLAADGYANLNHFLIVSFILISYFCFYLTFKIMHKQGFLWVSFSYLLLFLGAIIGSVQANSLASFANPYKDTVIFLASKEFIRVYAWMPVIVACIIGLLVAKRRLLK